MKQDYLLRRTGFSSRYIIIGLTVAVLVLLAIVFRVSLTRDLCYGIHGKPKKEIICFEEETKDLTGISQKLEKALLSHEGYTHLVNVELLGLQKTTTH